MEPWMWAVIAIVVLLVIVLLVMVMRKNSVASKRAQAAELRQKAQENDRAVREQEASAAKTQAAAQAAEAEAKHRAAEAQERALEAERLSAQAQDKGAAYHEARAERDGLLHRADEVDPDVREPRHGAQGRDPRGVEAEDVRSRRTERPAAGQRGGDRDNDGRYEMTERAHDKLDDVRGRHDADRDGRRG